MNNRLHQVLLAVVLMVAAVPAFAVAELPDTRPRATDEALREALQDIRRRHGVPGLAAAVFDRETVRAFGVGELARDGNPVTPQSRFRVGQVGVLFTGMAMAALVADGSIPVGAPVNGELRRLAPEVDVHNPWSNERPVRVTDLLSHRAGLGATHFRDVYTAAPGQPLLAAINSAFRALRVEYRPGDRQQYSVVGPAIAAYLVEKAAGLPYEDVLARMFFEPLQTPASVGRPDGALTGDATGHAGSPARALAPLPLNFATSGGLWISAEGLARTGQLLLDDGRYADREVLAPEAIQWLEAPGEGSPALVPGSRRGVHAEDVNGFLFYTQTGSLPGFLARFAYSPELGAGYVVLLNHGGARAALAEADALLRGQLMNNVGRAPAVPAAAGQPQASLSGWYRQADAEPPQRALYQPWLGIARMQRCGEAWCFSDAGGTVVLEAFDARRLRESGRWYPGWEVRATENDRVLATANHRWTRIPGWQAAGALALAIIVLAGVVAATAYLPAWTLALLRLRLSRANGFMVEVLPRLLPLAAMIAVVAFQVLLFATNYPALGVAGPASIAILVFSIVAPLLAPLALSAAIFGVVRGLPLPVTLPALFISSAAMIAAVAMFSSGLVFFQTWNY